MKDNQNCIYVSTEVNLGHDSAIDMRLKLDYDNISEYSDEKTYEEFIETFDLYAECF